MNYTIDEQDLERQQLLAKILEPATKQFLDTLRVSPTRRCLDLGCGIGETTRLIAGSLGPKGECVGIDQDAALIERAEASPWSGTSVSFRVGDATTLPFEDDVFDLVFTRYLLVHVPEPLRVVREMRRVARKGACIAAQEPDLAFNCCYPESWAYSRVPDLCKALFPDALLGRKLVALFRDAGCRSVSTLAHIGIEAEGSEMKRLYRMTLEGMGPALIQGRMVGEEELEEMRREFLRVETDASVVCIGNPAVTAWSVV